MHQQANLLPSVMQAVRLYPPGGPEGLQLDTIDVPRPGADEALVRVHAAAVTRDELGWPTDRLPAIPSYELSGVVAAAGADVETVSSGEPVFSLTGFERDGAAAEYVAVPAARLAPKPATLTHVESAALTLAGLTAWQGLFDQGGLRGGERVLVTGAGGDVGRLAIQLARHHGAYVIGMASGPAADQVRQLGAQVFDRTTSDAHELDPVDLVLDTAGGEALARAAAWLGREGRLVSVAEDPARLAGGIDARYFVVEPDRAQLVELARLVDAGTLRVVVDAVYPLRDARAAFARSMARERRGKVVLRVVE